MDNYAEYHKFIICPYNNSHRIEEGTRFQRHLIECRKNYPDIEEEVCPFNFTHRIKKPELKYHVSTCPDAGHAIKQIVTVKDEERFQPPVLGESYQDCQEHQVRPEECWDDDLLAAPVLTERTGWSSNLQILNADRLSGLKPAERRRILKQLGQGNNLEDIKNSQQEEKEEKEEQIKISGTVLRQLPLPSLEPSEVFKPMGRGFVNSDVNSSRIAANIFSGASYPIFTPIVPSYNMSMGLGRGIAPLARPPPGLVKPQTQLPHYGRGMATLPKVTDNRKAPPGFGTLADSNSEKNDKDENNLIADLGLLNLDKDEMILELHSKPQLSEQEERAKRKRRIEKKLKQIEHLKNKIKGGETLNDEEYAKVKGEKKLREEYGELDH